MRWPISNISFGNLLLNVFLSEIFPSKFVFDDVTRSVDVSERNEIFSKVTTTTWLDENISSSPLIQLMLVGDDLMSSTFDFFELKFNRIPKHGRNCNIVLTKNEHKSIVVIESESMWAETTFIFMDDLKTSFPFITH